VKRGSQQTEIGGNKTKRSVAVKLLRGEPKREAKDKCEKGKEGKGRGGYSALRRAASKEGRTRQVHGGSQSLKKKDRHGHNNLQQTYSRKINGEKG